MNPGSIPRRNRVTPHGTFEAVAERGAFLGNRGCLHDDAGQIGSKPFRRLAWLVCELQFRGRRLPINAPGAYTALFFLDEATALAAGHRPCSLCRRPTFKAFRDAWQLAHGLARLPLAMEIDTELHRSRIDYRGHQRTHMAQLRTLPDGTMIETPGSVGRSALLWDGEVHPWSHEGYGAPLDIDPLANVTVLTPRPTVAILHVGYRPEIAIERPPAADISTMRPLIGFETQPT